MRVKIFSGLGNQMFQYAFYLALKQKNKDICVEADNGYCFRINEHNGYELERVFGIKDVVMDEQGFLFREKHRHLYHMCERAGVKYGKIFNHCFEIVLGYYDKILNITDPKCSFEGYWQSERYFENVKEIVRNTFVFPKFNDSNNLKCAQSIQNTNSVSLHIRRGDFLEYSLFTNLCETQYYQRAVSYFEQNLEKPNFYIFSDDIDWTKNFLSFSTSDIHYVDWNVGENSYKDMQLMSMCKHNIIANSTFSWWGAWLNNYSGKKVIAPQSFYTIPNKKSDHIFPKEWLVI